jgi:uncharacterized membrane protein YfcA
MVAQELSLAFVVTACALAQSLFGVGILVFGTPMLLLMGLPFPTVLADLLPCSIAVNLFQVLQYRGCSRNDFRRELLLFCLPLVGVGLFVVLKLGANINLRPYVGAMLLGTAALRLLSQSRPGMRRLLESASPPLLAVTGFVHGMTNLGGGLLTALVSSRFDNKEEVRANIAFGYLMMACSQAFILLATRAVRLAPAQLYLPLLAAAVYMTVGNRLFRSATPRTYQHAVTALLLAFGCFLFT